MRRSALIMTNCWRFTVVQISSVFVMCVQWITTEAMLQFLLQKKGLKNRQKQLVEIQKKSLQKIQEREKELQRLRQAVESFKLSEKGAAEASEGILTELIHSIQRRSIDATELIGDQEKTTVSQAVGLLKHLEKEIADMRRRDAELEKLSRTTDNVNFLQSFQSFLLPRDSTTRKLFLQLSCQLSLDPNTAHKHLRLSEGNREVAYGKEAQPFRW
ncbi:hypothetical protein MATL_G00070170 [Megalops atlanticus]|uniref:Uncharacterized protein n=1 Tax=Megalops atlanticus TaxID=7932 RepID=A0A9D3Q460_MEGAT|nr:hypothetical protein MATL_G00070170 [Megalops atlanticus]